MKKMFLSALAVAALAFVGCTEDATNDLAQENGGAAVELHEISFEAEIEQPSRTSLVDPGTGTSYVCWDANDVIGVICDDGNIYQATITSGAGTPWAKYTGKISGTPVAAVYPYSFANSDNPSITYDSDFAKSKIGLLFPNFQIHKAGSVFSDNVNAMVALADENTNGTMFKFKSVMGALELKFTGSQTVNGITVKTKNKDAKVSGVGYVTLGDDGSNTLAMATDMTAQSYVNLEVPEAVTLSGTATSFYVLVPAGTYEGLQIGVMTEDGSYVRTATKAHTVKAGEILPINCGNLDTMVDKASAVNLSADGYANCYVVVPDGSVKTYSFDIKLVDGTIPTNAHITKSNASIENSAEAIAPHMAQILWAEDLKVAYDIHFDREAGKIYFKNDGKTLGNTRILLTCDPFAVAKSAALNTTKKNDNSTTVNEAYVCAFNEKAIKIKRAEQTFLWGWHIWSTPTKLDYSETRVPSWATDSNGDGMLSPTEIRKYGRLGWMDRNLGATWLAKTKSALDSATDQNFVDAIGLYYEFGYMNPYPRPTALNSHANGDWGYARTPYQYGFTQYTMGWTHSSSYKTTVEETLQFPYHFYTKSHQPGDVAVPKDADSLALYKKHFGNTTTRNSWIDAKFKGGGLVTDTPPAFWSGYDTRTKTTTKSIYDPCPAGYIIPHQGNVYRTCDGEDVQFLADGATEAVTRNGGEFSVTCTRKINSRPVGTYITYNGTNIDFWPNSGYSGSGKVTINTSGNLSYFWATTYAEQIENYEHKLAGENFGTYTSYNTGTRGTFAASNKGTWTQFWPQPATGYNVRCMKYVPATTASATSYSVDGTAGF